MPVVNPAEVRQFGLVLSRFSFDGCANDQYRRVSDPVDSSWWCTCHSIMSVQVSSVQVSLPLKANIDALQAWRVSAGD